MSERATWMKMVLSWIGVFAFRFLLLPMRAPNVEPLLSVVMPLSTRVNLAVSFLFSFSSILLYDIITSGIGTWSWVTAIAYGVISVGAALYFRYTEPTRMRYVGYAVIATLFYDAVTGLTVGPLFFGQPFMAALIGQIPFTVLHLLGAIVFAYFLSPALASWFAGQAVRMSTKPAAHTAAVVRS